MVGGSLRVLRLLPPLKLVTMILLKVAVNTIKIKSKIEPRLNNGYAMYHIDIPANSVPRYNSTAQQQKHESN
jgi:hypothetical protein